MSEVVNSTRSLIVYQILEMEMLSEMIWRKKGQFERCDEQAILRGQGTRTVVEEEVYLGDQGVTRGLGATRCCLLKGRRLIGAITSSHQWIRNIDATRLDKAPTTIIPVGTLFFCSFIM